MKEQSEELIKFKNKIKKKINELEKEIKELDFNTGKPNLIHLEIMFDNTSKIELLNEILKWK